LKEEIWFLNIPNQVQKNPQGGIVKKEAPIHVSNIALVDSKTKSATKVGFKIEGDKKVRFSKKSNQVL